jgi:hypothetical protein
VNVHAKDKNEIPTISFLLREKDTELGRIKAGLRFRFRSGGALYEKSAGDLDS